MSAHTVDTALVGWCREELSRLLQNDIAEDIVRYILGIEDVEELQEYLFELLDGSNREHKQFVDDLVLRVMNPPAVPENVHIYRKKDDVDEIATGAKGKAKKNKHKPEKQKIDLMKVPYKPRMPGDPSPVEDEIIPNSKSPPQSDVNKQGAKKKQKFVALYSKEGEEKSTVKIPGRHPCECQAHRHRLVNNCIKCGRVVCDQEGAGPCFFCGSLVCSSEQLEILARNSHKSEKLMRKLMGDVIVKDKALGTVEKDSSKLCSGLDKAIMHKNKLIEYDKTSARRTHVIDDESDYFATDTNRWLSKKEREVLKNREDELREQRHGSRRGKKITLDFAGRKVIEDNEPINMYDREDAVVQAVNFGTDYRTESQKTSGLIKPGISQPAPKFVLDNKSQASTGNSKSEISQSRILRIQDKELLEMSDDGMCLSMHQPWASLLIAGIKKHEGRTWYSAHRGRLWIAAAANRPTPQEIAEVENAHKIIYPNEHFDFPSQYPVSCLLGSVDVTDCLSQEQYREKIPDGESGSPYIFICENPLELIVKFPIKGKHKIWKLDPHIHQAAKKGLRRK
ncbi:activating signal cointegrator 1-like [Saccoglossus kowalevskii]|uniref:Activating signal cointegrator 1-like n=1 Tax=Saccoglossus kowalevskii TaxID=10224 RepID=A0ABM0GJQ7_SACKO|nr:PREDICTED: activating signal cointegrator 1-like [Saccoglossus kowalevskii]